MSSVLSGISLLQACDYSTNVFHLISYDKILVMFLDQIMLYYLSVVSNVMSYFYITKTGLEPI